MQHCKICDKQMYGHSVSSDGPLVCGSCTLSPVKDGKVGVSQSKVRMNMGSILTQEVDKRKLVSMAEIIVKSNYARNRTILLDGRYPLSFNEDGLAKCPAHLREALDREMASKPGRYCDTAEVASVEVAAIVEVPAEETVVEEVPVEETKQLDLPFAEEKQSKQVVTHTAKNKKK